MLEKKQSKITAMELIQIAITELKNGDVQNALYHDKLAVEISINGDGTTLMDEDCPAMLLVQKMRETVRRFPTVARLWE